MDDLMTPPPEYMDQRISGSNEDMAMYVTGCRAELKNCIMRTLQAVAMGIYNSGAASTEFFDKLGRTCYQRYFNSMKGATNLSPEDVTSFIAGEAERQRKLHGALKHLAGCFRRYGVKLEILAPGQVYSDPAWQMPLSTGTTVRIENRAYITAFPPRPAVTANYMALRQDPVAAELIYMDSRMMLFAQHGQDTGEAFLKACRSLWPEPVDVTPDFGGALMSRISGNVLLLDTGKEPADKDLDDLMDKYSLSGVIVADSSSFHARLYIAGYVISRLEYELAD